MSYLISQGLVGLGVLVNQEMKIVFAMVLEVSRWRWRSSKCSGLKNMECLEHGTKLKNL